jgi:hypothetical protein
MFFDNLSAQPIIVAGVEAEILWLSLRWLRTLDHDRFDRLSQQEMIIDIGRGDDDRQWPSPAINQQAFFEPCLARSVGLGPILSPPQRALPSAPSAACHCQSRSPNSSHSASSKDQIISKSPILARALEGSMDGRVVPIDFGDLIPIPPMIRLDAKSTKV